MSRFQSNCKKERLISIANTLMHRWQGVNRTRGRIKSVHTSCIRSTIPSGNKNRTCSFCLLISSSLIVRFLFLWLCSDTQRNFLVVHSFSTDTPPCIIRYYEKFKPWIPKAAQVHSRRLLPWVMDRTVFGWIIKNAISRDTHCTTKCSQLGLLHLQINWNWLHF